jgi:hypothetical protein
MASVIRADEWQKPNGTRQSTVIQVVQTVFRDTFSTAIGAGWADVTGLNCTITPTYTTSRILVSLRCVAGAQYWQNKIRLMRNGAEVTGATGNPNGARPAVWLNQIRYDTGAGGGQDIYDMSCMAGDYIDTPGTTGSLTYGIQLGGYSTSYTVYINRSHNYSASTSYDGAPISTLTLTEIAL